MKKYDKYDLIGIPEKYHDTFVNRLRMKIKDRTVKTEAEAKTVARLFMEAPIYSYQLTLAVSQFLPKKVKKVISTKTTKNENFVGTVKKVVYEDIWGRYWSKSTGRLKDEHKGKIALVEGVYRLFDDNGMWTSKKGKTFIFEYRIN